jgi:hypothetical protein
LLRFSPVNPKTKSDRVTLGANLWLDDDENREARQSSDMQPSRLMMAFAGLAEAGHRRTVVLIATRNPSPCANEMLVRQVEPGDNFATFAQKPIAKKRSQLLIT